MHTPEARCCPEYAELSRRQFVGYSAGSALLASIATSYAWLPRVSVAESHRSSQRDVMVHIYLRGASDGLTMCVPYADSAYYAARTSIAVARPDTSDPNRATDLDGFFGLPPAMLPLRQAYLDGKLLFVHACGSNDPSRSHFEAQRFMEVGKPGDNTISTGWLGRHVASVAPMDPNAQLRAVGIATGLQQALVGGPRTLPISNLDTFGLTGNNGTRTARSAALAEMYETAREPLAAAALTTFQTIDLLNTIDFANYVPYNAAVYPTNAFGNALKSAAALIKANVGVEAIAVDLGGWDTHANQGSVTGTMANLMTSLAGGMGAFYTDLQQPGAPSTITVAMSEFGRRVRENGTQGCDHGHGNAMLVMGNAVAGGRVLRNWPGLDPANLYEGLDLQVTIDYRDILAEIVQQRLGNAELSTVFPGFTPTFRGVLA